LLDRPTSALRRSAEQLTGAVDVRLGATEVAARVQHGVHAKVTARSVLVNGDPGILAWNANGEPRSVMACTVVDGRIVEILSVTDRARLAAMDLPERSVAEQLD